MKVLLLSRPVVNAGDFLFTEKSVDAFDDICPGACVEKGHLTGEYTVDYLNGFDSVVLAGGPLYDDRFLNVENTPILGLLDRVKPKFYILSAGWYGRTAFIEDIYKFSFSPDSLKILKSIENKGGVLSVRDDITARVLQNNGLKSVKMVGCVAWYDHRFIDSTDPVRHGKVSRIIISDQGITKDNTTWDWKYKSLECAVKTIKASFPGSDIHFTFNGGIDTKYSGKYNNRITKLLESENITYSDISGSTKGFELYDTADLHVGFRVHSHIYCMSRRIPSILICEDARGSGCNESMGLPDIKDYSVTGGELSENSYLGNQLNYYIKDLVSDNFGGLSSSYIRMKHIYESRFVPLIKQICE